MLLNKVDLLRPTQILALRGCIAGAREVGGEIILISATSGEGMWISGWHGWRRSDVCIKALPGSNHRAIDGNQAKVDVCGIQRDVDLR